ncbi:MAG TPA: inorganic diphosphatase [Candidatus Aquicultor sp.]
MRSDRCYETIMVVVEIPKGSRNKYEYDEKLGCFKFDRLLFSSVHYPADYGFVPDTLAEDGDPLDALVVLEEPTFTGCLIEAKPVGLFKMWDEKGPDHKILCVPVADPRWNYINSLEEVPQHLLHEISHFFEVYKDLEAKKTGVEGWESKEDAYRIIEAAVAAYGAKQAGTD